MSTRPKPYLCKHCGENNVENFLEKRYTTCKKCRNLQSNNSHIKKEIFEKGISFLCDKELEKNIEQYFCSYHRIFGNRSVVDILNFNEKEIDELKDENEDKTNKIDILLNDQSEINCEISNLFKEIKKVCDENLEIKKENLEIKKENLEIKNKLNQILNVLNLKI
jgi:hypothetical protein